MISIRTTVSAGRSILIRVGAVAFTGALAGCVGDKPLQLESKVDGTLTTVIKLEGPIQMQMQGPIVRYEGTYVSDDLLARVEVGKTTEDWIVALLGEPTAKSPLKDGSEVWRWTYRPVEQTGSVLEFFGGSEKEPKLATRAVFVQMRAGLAIDKWKS